MISTLTKLFFRMTERLTDEQLGELDDRLRRAGPGEAIRVEAATEILALRARRNGEANRRRGGSVPRCRKFRPSPLICFAALPTRSKKLEAAPRSYCADCSASGAAGGGGGLPAITDARVAKLEAALLVDGAKLLARPRGEAGGGAEFLFEETKWKSTATTMD